MTVTFSDAAASAIPATTLTSGTFRPANYTDTSPGGDNYPNPAPPGPFGTLLSAFNGFSPNGVWSLYLVDDGPGDQGRVAGGWTMAITTAGDVAVPPTISSIADQSTVGTLHKVLRGLLP